MNLKKHLGTALLALTCGLAGGSQALADSGYRSVHLYDRDDYCPVHRHDHQRHDGHAWPFRGHQQHHRHEHYGHAGHHSQRWHRDDHHPRRQYRDDQYSYRQDRDDHHSNRDSRDDRQHDSEHRNRDGHHEHSSRRSGYRYYTGGV